MMTNASVATSKRDESYYYASQGQLIWRRLKKHKLAMASGVILILLYLVAIFSDFFIPYDPVARNTGYLNAPPQAVQLFSQNGFQPHVLGFSKERDKKTLAINYVPDPEQVLPIRFMSPGFSYKLFGLVDANIHLFTVEEGTVFLFGTDALGRDIYSRTISALRISLFIGLIGVALSFLLGVTLGGISGYFGGRIDFVIQRVIELILSLPTIPLWLALSAALPPQWSSTQIFFGITIILSLIVWCGIARVVRGKFLELREQDFIAAAVVSGASSFRVIFKHLVPSFSSYLIVQLTLLIPGVILGEVALSFLGLGIQAPAVSLGTLLQDINNIRAVSIYPWMMIPALFVVGIVLAFNFFGDGIRDAADPYK